MYKYIGLGGGGLVLSCRSRRWLNFVLRVQNAVNSYCYYLYLSGSGIKGGACVYFPRKKQK